MGRPSIEVFVDDEDFPYLSQFKWWMNGAGYIVGRIGGKEVYMHRVVMGDPADKVIDHRNHNKRDNQRRNLRVCNTRQNVINSSVSKNNKSGTAGVSYRTDKKKWRAFIMVNRKQISLGSYENKADAIQARLEGEKKYFGEFAPKH